MQEKQEQCAGHMTPARSECHIWATLRQGRDPSKTEACVCFCANCKQDWWNWEASTEMGGLLHQFPPQQRSKGPRGLPENVVGKAKLVGAQSISTTAQGLGAEHTRWSHQDGLNLQASAPQWLHFCRIEIYLHYPLSPPVQSTVDGGLIGTMPSCHLKEVLQFPSRAAMLGVSTVGRKAKKRTKQRRALGLAERGSAARLAHHSPHALRSSSSAPQTVARDHRSQCLQRLKHWHQQKPQVACLALRATLAGQSCQLNWVYWLGVFLGPLVLV